MGSANAVTSNCTPCSRPYRSRHAHRRSAAICSSSTRATVSIDATPFVSRCPHRSVILASALGRGGSRVSLPRVGRIHMPDSQTWVSHPFTGFNRCDSIPGNSVASVYWDSTDATDRRHEMSHPFARWKRMRHPRPLRAVQSAQEPAQSTPWATMALATLTKPAALAPSMRSPSWPYSFAAARESATMVSMMDLSLASTSSKVQLRR